MSYHVRVDETTSYNFTSRPGLLAGIVKQLAQQAAREIFAADAGEADRE